MQLRPLHAIPRAPDAVQADHITLGGQDPAHRLHAGPDMEPTSRLEAEWHHLLFPGPRSHPMDDTAEVTHL